MKGSSMFRLLNKEARAPLPAVHKAIRRYRRSASSSMSDYMFNRECIAILHEHNWRKRDYVRELHTRVRKARLVQRTMCKRPFAP
jgi:hypothetical protein